jgi:hypothetical protein
MGVPSGAVLGVSTKLVRVAEPAERIGACGGLSDTQRSKVLDSHLDVRANFVIEILLQALAVCRQLEKASYSRWQLREAHHRR